MTTSLFPAAQYVNVSGATISDPQDAFGTEVDNQAALGAAQVSDWSFGSVSLPDGAVVSEVRVAAYFTLLTAEGFALQGKLNDSLVGSPVDPLATERFPCVAVVPGATAADVQRVGGVKARVTFTDTGEVDYVRLEVDYATGPALMDPQPPPAPLWRGQGDQGPWYEGDDYRRAKRYQNEPETE